MISKGRVIRTGLFFALANFVITAAIGALLRFNDVFPISTLPTRNWIHAHSHTGFLGWVFIALATLAFGMLLPKNGRINRRSYRLIIYLQIAVMGMLVTFPFMGYAAPSIIFSTFQMILSLIFAILFFKNADKNDLASKFMRAGLVFMLISGLGPLTLGPVVVMDMKGTTLYDMAIYFYLHFQYNGWFTMAVFALLFKMLDGFGIEYSKAKGVLIYKLLIFATMLTFALSTLSFGPNRLVYFIGFIGAVLQLWAGFILLRILFVKTKLSIVLFNGWVKWFFGIALASWLLKIMMQFLSPLPFISEFAYFNREAIMTYLHLSFLGFTSCFLIGLLIVKNYLSTSGTISKVGFGLILVGVILMELTVGLRALPQFLNLSMFKLLNAALFGESLMLFFGIAILLFLAFIFPNRAIKQKRFS